MFIFPICLNAPLEKVWPFRYGKPGVMEGGLFLDIGGEYHYNLDRWCILIRNKYERMLWMQNILVKK